MFYQMHSRDVVSSTKKHSAYQLRIVSDCKLESDSCSAHACLGLCTTLFRLILFFGETSCIFTMMIIACFEALRIGILYHRYTVLSGIWHTRGTAKNFYVQSKVTGYVTYSSSLQIEPKNIFVGQKLMSLRGKHRGVPDMLSSSSSCCLSITFDRVTKNTNYLQEIRGLSCQKGSHTNRHSSISSHLCCECIFFYTKYPQRI